MESGRKKILMVAYACNPAGGGEHWLGWQWALVASRRHDVWLIAPPKHREEMEAAGKAAGIRVHCVELPPRWLALCMKLGGMTTWLPKYLWQYQAERAAAKLHAEVGFDLVHQTTFHTFRVPFACANLGIPAVWGPVAGGERIPAGFEKYLGGGAWRETLRSSVNRLCLYHPGVRRSFEQVKCILVSNRTTMEFLPVGVRPKCVLVPANALREEDVLAEHAAKPVRTGKRLELIYVGNCVNRRGLGLAFDVLRRFRGDEVRLRVVGNGEALESWKAECQQAGLLDRVEFTGGVDATTVRRFFDESDALMFPSLRDSGGSPLLEAMTRGLPVICLDWGGPGEMVDEGSGIKLPVDNPKDTLDRMEAAIRQLCEDPEFGRRIGAAGRVRALERFTWESKGKALEAIYQRAWGTR